MKRGCSVLLRRFRLQDLKLQNIVFYGIALYIVVMLFVQQSSLDSQRKAYEDSVKQLEAAKQYNEQLQEQSKYVETDEYLEELAREEGYVEEDEIVFISGN